MAKYPPGFRFVPNDEELIVDYLKNKINDEPLPMDEIRVVDIYEYSPDLFADKYPEVGEREWYFFTPRNRKYPNGSRPNRCISSEDGFWKATGADTRVYSSSDEKSIVGFKKSLVFYKGKPPHGQKTNWLMHEYRFNQPPRTNNKRDASGNMKLDDYVLCRLYKKRSSWKAEGEQQQQVADHDHTTGNTSIVQYEGVIPPISTDDYDYSHDDELILANELHINIGGGMQQQQEQGATAIVQHGDSSDCGYDDDDFASLFLVPNEPQTLSDIDFPDTFSWFQEQQQQPAHHQLPILPYYQQEAAADDHQLPNYYYQMEDYSSTKRPHIIC